MKHKVHPTVLIVDNEPDILELMSYNFRKRGFQVILADNGIEAMKAYLSYQPDIILLDIRMPGIDGIQTCRKLRLLPKGKDAYIVLFTAMNGYEGLVELAGANALVKKTTSPATLVNTIEEMFVTADLLV